MTMSQDAPATVSRPLEGRLLLSDRTSISFAARLHYDVKDPYAVTITFLFEDESEVEWVFGRELLADGLNRQVGEGDVMLRPTGEDCSPEVELVLSTPGSHVRLALPADSLAAFVRASHAVVPPGAETQHLDIDTAISEILSDEIA
jgi:hypothetical protein